MPTHHSNLPAGVTNDYWAKVLEILQGRHRLSLEAGKLAIRAYQEALDRGGAGDEIYHAPVGETAQEIVVGGYAIVGTQESDSTLKPQKEKPLSPKIKTKAS